VTLRGILSGSLEVRLVLHHGRLLPSAVLYCIVEKRSPCLVPASADLAGEREIALAKLKLNLERELGNEDGIVPWA